MITKVDNRYGVNTSSRCDWAGMDEDGGTTVAQK